MCEGAGLGKGNFGLVQKYLRIRECSTWREGGARGELGSGHGVGGGARGELGFRNGVEGRARRRPGIKSVAAYPFRGMAVKILGKGVGSGGSGGGATVGRERFRWAERGLGGEGKVEARRAETRKARGRAGAGAWMEG